MLTNKSIGSGLSAKKIGGKCTTSIAFGRPGAIYTTGKQILTKPRAQNWRRKSKANSRMATNRKLVRKSGETNAPRTQYKTDCADILNVTPLLRVVFGSIRFHESDGFFTSGYRPRSKRASVIRSAKLGPARPAVFGEQIRGFPRCCFGGKGRRKCGKFLVQ